MEDNREALDYFIKDRNAGQMLSFFTTLKQWSKKYDEMIFVSRKGYWTYRLLAQYDESICMDHVRSDRYLMKALDDNLFKDKNICLIDDIMSTGFRLFRYYCILEAKGAKKVKPAVYAQSIEFPQQSELERMIDIYLHVNHKEERGEELLDEAKRKRRKFLGRLYCEQYLAQGNITKLCLLETEIQQTCLCPQAIDLPMIVSKKNGSILKDKFVLSKEQFQKLCNARTHWMYIRNVYDTYESEASDENDKNSVQGVLKIPIQCNYFECQESTLKRLCHSILVSGVVKCKYNVDEHNKYHLLFTPFAILRSFKKTHLKGIFRQLFWETDYGNTVWEKMEQDTDTKDDFVWICALHAVTFGISLYIGKCFKKYLCDCLGKEIGMEVGYDWAIMEDNSDGAFIKAMQDIMVNIDYRMLQMVEYCENRISYHHPDLMGMKRYSLSAAYEDVYSLILQTWNQGEENNTIAIEQIEDALRKEYVFSDKIAMRQGVVSIILLMLEINVFGNYVNVQKDNVIRSFRCGENSGLLLTKAGRLCYSLAEILYFVQGKKAYYNCAEEYFNSMLDYLMKKNIFENYICESDFKIYIKWFVDESVMPKDKLHGHIMGKQFLLKKIDDKLEQVRKYAMWYAEEINK